MFNRRQFLKMTAIAGTGSLAGLAAVNHESIEKLFSLRDQYRVTQSRFALGTRVDITAVGPGQIFMQDAVSAAFDDIAAFEADFSRYNGKSPICELNAEGKITHIPPAILDILRLSMKYHKETGGAFDITVKPFIDLFAKCNDSGRTPSESEIAEASARVGAEKLHFINNTIDIPQGSGITLDGIAPGYIADRTASFLNNKGISNYLINAGGEIRTSGHPQNAEHWRIAIQDPNHGSNYPGFIALKNGAVSTSGSYEIYFGEDRKFHHIVNAQTGKCPQDIVSVTVTAPTAAEADILSTALFVMSPAEALAYAAAHPHIACFMIDAQGNSIASPNFILS